MYIYTVCIYIYIMKSESESHSVVSDSLQPHGLHSPWNSPGQNTGLGSLSFLQGIFPTQGSNPGLPHCRRILYQLSHHMTTGKIIALIRQTFVSKGMSLLFNMLSRLVIAFLPRSKRLFISWLQSPSAVILEPKKIKYVTVFHCCPIYLPWSDGTRCHIFVFWMLNFKPAVSLSSFTFIKRPFCPSLFSTIRVVSSAYLRLLIFLLAVLIPACASSSLAFCMMYSAYKLNKQGDNIQPRCTAFPIWSQSIVPCPVLTVASWPHTDVSGGRSGGLVCPSLSEFSTVCCDPHSQRL